MTVKHIPQEHIAIVDGKEVHLILPSTLRQIANGQKIDSELSRIIARAYLRELRL